MIAAPHGNRSVVSCQLLVVSCSDHRAHELMSQMTGVGRPARLVMTSFAARVSASGPLGGCWEGVSDSAPGQPAVSTPCAPTRASYRATPASLRHCVIGANISRFGTARFRTAANRSRITRRQNHFSPRNRPLSPRESRRSSCVAASWSCVTASSAKGGRRAAGREPVIVGHSS
jgi:hypothetical protein